MLLLKRFFAIAVLVLPVATHANTLIEIRMNPNEGGFAFSTLHTGEASCQTIGGVDFCMSGRRQALEASASSGLYLSGTLDENLLLTQITGSISVLDTGPITAQDVAVIGGSLDLAMLSDGIQSQRWAGELVTRNLGTFSFLDESFAGAANSYDTQSGALRLWGNNWSDAARTTGGVAQLGIDLGGRLSVVPEPGAGLLSLVALAFTTLSVRRRSHAGR